MHTKGSRGRISYSHMVFPWLPSAAEESSWSGSPSTPWGLLWACFARGLGVYLIMGLLRSLCTSFALSTDYWYGLNFGCLETPSVSAKGAILAASRPTVPWDNPQGRSRTSLVLCPANANRPCVCSCSDDNLLFCIPVLLQPDLLWHPWCSPSLCALCQVVALLLKHS